MEITRKLLSEYSKYFLDILGKEEVKTVGDLERLAGQTIPVDGRKQDYVSIRFTPSNGGTTAIDASYIVQHRQDEIGGGAPLCLKVNTKLGYSQIMIKTNCEIEGYSPFGKDPFENILQAKIIKSTDWQEIRREIENL